MQGFTQDSFRQMCILSGCDYLSSIPGVGLGKALKFMRKFNQNPYKVKTYTDTEGRQHLWQLLVLTNSDPMFYGIQGDQVSAV